MSWCCDAEESATSQQTDEEQPEPESGLPTAAGLVEHRGDTGASTSAATATEQQRSSAQLAGFVTERVRDVRSGNGVVGVQHCRPVTYIPQSPTFFLSPSACLAPVA